MVEVVVGFSTKTNGTAVAPSSDVVKPVDTNVVVVVVVMVVVVVVVVVSTAARVEGSDVVGEAREEPRVVGSEVIFGKIILSSGVVSSSGRILWFSFRLEISVFASSCKI